MSRKGSFAGRLENGPLDGGRGIQQFFSDVGAATVSPRVGFETAWGAREIRPSDVSNICLRTEVEPDSAAAAHAGVCSRKSQSRNAAKAFRPRPLRRLRYRYRLRLQARLRQREVDHGADVEAVHYCRLCHWSGLSVANCGRCAANCRRAGLPAACSAWRQNAWCCFTVSSRRPRKHSSRTSTWRSDGRKEKAHEEEQYRIILR